jgi:hypothetical protein
VTGVELALALVLVGGVSFAAGFVWGAVLF